MNFSNKKGFRSRKGQVTIFIVIAVMLVAITVGYFMFRGRLVGESGVPVDMQPIYNTFLQCIEEDSLVGASVLESQGGYIELPDFEAGSNAMPFSSHLNFLGNPIPYWYYVAGNGIEKQQVPTKSSMEEELAGFIEAEVRDCIFEQYVEDGYDINMGEPEVDVSINSEDISISVDLPLTIQRAEDIAVVRNHQVIVNSKLGKLYDSAREIYDYEQETLFLENYGLDTLRLYAPVDGVEVTCSPQIWNAEEVFDEVANAIQSNVQAIRVSSGDFELANPENKYFVKDIPVDSDVRFLNSVNWPNSFEVNPTQGSAMIAKPVGNNPGMAAMGFCYVPYHFVYNVNYPVLVQVYDGEEIFQFPMAVIIKGNLPREPAEGAAAYDAPTSGMCERKISDWGIYTFDNYLNPVEAEISFKCFNEICDIGTTDGDSGLLQDKIPQCGNSYLVARAEGYEDATYALTSSVQDGIADILMNKIYPKEVRLNLDRSVYNGDAIITFESSSGISRSVTYPDEKLIDLSAGNWTVRVFIYRDSQVTIPETTQEQCVDAPQAGIGALFGATEERCFDITIPAQTIDGTIKGGGNQVYYIIEEELVSSSIIDINAKSLPTPTGVEDLQKSYDALEAQGLDIELL